MINLHKLDGAGKRGLGVTVYSHADVIIQVLERCNSPVCWVVIYKVCVFERTILTVKSFFRM